MGWSPEKGYIPYDWAGYNEAMLVVLLALGSPTHPVGESAWSAWSDSYRGAWGRFMGYEHLSFAPLFGHQYSHVWIDFRGIQDATMRERGIDYFENTRRAVYAQRAYAIANPKGYYEYGANIWGFTACDGPGKLREFDRSNRFRYFLDYSARGAGRYRTIDDGTIAPTAALVVAAVRARDRASRRSRRCTRATASSSTRSTASSIRSTAASSPPTSSSPTAASTRRSAGSRTTASASTRARSSR